MAYRRNGIYYVDVRPKGYGGRVGPLSTRVRDRTTASQMEALVKKLAITGRRDLLDGLVAGEFTLPALYAADLSGEADALLAEKDDPSLKAVVSEFIRNHDDERYVTGLGRLLEFAPVGARVSWVCDPRNLQAFVHSQRDRNPATVRREFAGVNILIRESVGEAVRAEVMREVSLPRVARGRTRWLDTDEIEIVREHAGDWWLFFSLAISTGMRRGELMRLRVKDVDFDHGTVRVEHGKSAAARRTVLVGGTVLNDLKAWVEREGLSLSDPMFPGLTRREVRKAWDHIREHLPEDARFHDLRHTYAVHMAKAGMPLGELQKRMGHSTITMTMRYAEYQPPTTSTHYDRALDSKGLTEPRLTAVA